MLPKPNIQNLYQTQELQPQVNKIFKVAFLLEIKTIKCFFTGVEDERKNGSDELHLNGSNNDDLNLPPLETNQPSLNSNGQSSTTVLFYQQRDFEESLDADVSDFITGELYLFY